MNIYVSQFSIVLYSFYDFFYIILSFLIFFLIFSVICIYNLFLFFYLILYYSYWFFCIHFVIIFVYIELHIYIHFVFVLSFLVFWWCCVMVRLKAMAAAEHLCCSPFLLITRNSEELKTQKKAFKIIETWTKLRIGAEAG